MKQEVKSFLNNLFNFQGRSNRGQHIIYLVILLGLGWLLNTLSFNLFFSTLLFIPSIICFVAYIATLVRRMHDLGMSAWWLIALIIPLVGLIFWLYLVFWPGMEETNQYGPPPPPFYF